MIVTLICSVCRWREVVNGPEIPERCPNCKSHHWHVPESVHTKTPLSFTKSDKRFLSGIKVESPEDDPAA